MKKFICANCGCEITGDVYVCQDNFLQVKYFETNALNRFCSQDCFCQSLFLDALDPEDVPLDDDEDIDDDDIDADIDNGRYLMIDFVSDADNKETKDD